MGPYSNRLGVYYPPAAGGAGGALVLIIVVVLLLIGTPSKIFRFGLPVVARPSKLAAGRVFSGRRKWRW